MMKIMDKGDEAGFWASTFVFGFLAFWKKEMNCFLASLGEGEKKT